MQRCLLSNFNMYRAKRFALTRARWPAAARILASRWEDLFRPEVGRRVFAFALYLAALDAEEAAATQMCRLRACTARYRTAG
jgi:hypothetical protein